MIRAESEHVILTVDGQTVQKLSNYWIIPQEIVDHDQITVESVEQIDDYQIDRSGLSDKIVANLETHYL